MEAHLFIIQTHNKAGQSDSLPSICVGAGKASHKH